MNELKIFQNEQFGSIRTVEVDGEPYFVGKDVATILGYSDTAKAIRVHVDEEDKQLFKVDEMATLKTSNYGITLINESGLYSLILSSKRPKAKEFKRWVTSEVLPTIRIHGMYVTEELLNDPDLAIRAFTALKEEREKTKALTAKIEQDRPKVLFADSVATAKSTILIGELAKILKQNGVAMGQNRLFEWLRREGYLISRKGTDYNVPTQKSMELGLFEIKETVINHADGHTTTTKTPKVTGKGQQYFINKFLAKRGE